MFNTQPATICTGMRHNQISNPGKSYRILWKYRVKKDQRNRFEAEYGPKGSWCRLFGKAKGYKDSILYRSDTDPDTYLLIDTWTDLVSYGKFMKENLEVYQRMSREFETLYISEEKIGTFEEVVSSGTHDGTPDLLG